MLGRFFYIFCLNRKKGLQVSYGAYVNFGTHLEGYNVVHKGANLSGSRVGYASYVGCNSLLPNIEIGRYCSIANDVEILSYTHPSSKFVSTHPAFYSLLCQAGFTYSKTQLFDEYVSVDVGSKSAASVVVGNDVWIGARVIIMGRVTIGDGAIIAAGSVVTKSVPSFAIVGGVPARIIKMRFTAGEIECLERVRWWNKGPGWLEKNALFFSDIKNFIEECGD